jgi:hypothetical protein
VNWILEAVFSEPDKTENKAMQVSPQESSQGQGLGTSGSSAGPRLNVSC